MSDCVTFLLDIFKKFLLADTCVFLFFIDP